MRRIRKMLATLATGAMIASTVPAAQAAERGMNGLFLGAGGGAILGQAIGRDTEGTLIGTAVGGVLGYIVGNEMDKQALRPVVTPPAGRVIVEREWERPCPSDYPPSERRRWREPRCRETEMLAMVDGRPEMVVATACLENGEWVIRDPGHQPVTQVVVIHQEDRHRRGGGPPPGRGWRREKWRKTSWR